MKVSQQELNERWRILKTQPTSDYAEARITEDSDLIQGLEVDELVESGSSAGEHRTVAYTRRRDSVSQEWGEWEDGYSASV
jgi:hypothetical protein